MGFRSWLLRPVTDRIDRRFKAIHYRVRNTGDHIMNAVDLSNRLQGLERKASAFAEKHAAAQAELASLRASQAAGLDLPPEVDETIARIEALFDELVDFAETQSVEQDPVADTHQSSDQPEA